MESDTKKVYEEYSDDRKRRFFVFDEGSFYSVRVEYFYPENEVDGYVNGTLQVTKADINPTVTLEGWTEGAAANTPKVTSNSGNGQVTFTYKVKDADDSTYTVSVPTQPGIYTVKATVAETANYNGVAATADFTITATGSDEPGTDDPEHTHSLVKVDYKDSTQDAEGNIEYWKCSGCDKLFSDSEGTNEITLVDTVIAKKKPTVTTPPVIKPTITLPSGSNTPAAKDTVLKATNANAEVVVTSKTGEPATAAYQNPIDPNVSNVTIPGSVSVGNVTYKVTEIEDGAFAGNNAVKNVKVEEGVESIGDNAFAGCENLKNLVKSMSKKVNIKVKKKVAAKYTAALNKVGFKGTVTRK